MFRGRERLVELGHIGVGVIADVAKPVVPDLLRLADEVVFIVLAEQAVGARMLLRSIYNALDLNSHIKLFQLVSRRGFELAGDVDDCADAALVRADRDDLPLVAVTLPCDVGVLIRIQVCMLGVDKRSGVERFDILVFFKLDLVCPDAVVILPDVFAVLQNFRISGGIRHAEIHTRVILPVLNMYAVGFFALDANRTALIQRGLSGRGHFMRGFDPRVRCRFHPLLIRLIIGEVERDGLRGRGVLHLPDQIAGLLHEPCRPDSHRADISARAIAYDLADRMLCVGRVSERILYRIMRSGCRNADNIYNNAGHVVFRGLGGLVGGWGLLAVLNLDHTQAVVQLPRVILVADYKLQRCLVRIVELMRLRFFAVVLCDIRRGLDGHVVFPRLIQSRRFRPVERLALRVVNQVVVFRPAAGRADVLYLNLPDSRFQIVIGGNRNRIAPFANGVDGLGAVFMFNVNRVARLILRSGRSRTVSPALEGAAIFGRDRTGDGKGNPVHRWMRCRTRLTSRRTGVAIRIILQFKEWHPDGVDGLGRIVLGQYDRISARVLRSHSIRLVRPSNVIIARAGQLRSINIKREGSRRRGPIRHIREPCAVRAVVILIIQIVHVGRSGGCTLKIIVSSVLTIDKERGAAFTSFVAATASPRNVVNLIVVYTFPDVLGIRKRKRIIVDVVLAKVNRDVIAVDFTYRMAVDCITDLDFHAGDSVVHRRMQHDRAITRRHRRHRQHAEHHNQN